MCQVANDNQISITVLANYLIPTATTITTLLLNSYREPEAVTTGTCGVPALKSINSPCTPISFLKTLNNSD